MSKLSCYKVALKVQWSSDDTAWDASGKHCFSVEGGALFVLAVDAKIVAQEFPHALKIERVGVGYELP